MDEEEEEDVEMDFADGADNGAVGPNEMINQTHLDEAGGDK